MPELPNWTLARSSRENGIKRTERARRAQQKNDAPRGFRRLLSISALTKNKLNRSFLEKKKKKKRFYLKRNLILSYEKLHCKKLSHYFTQNSFISSFSRQFFFSPLFLDNAKMIAIRLRYFEERSFYFFFITKLILGLPESSGPFLE